MVAVAARLGPVSHIEATQRGFLFAAGVVRERERESCPGIVGTLMSYGRDYGPNVSVENR